MVEPIGDREIMIHHIALRTRNRSALCDFLTLLGLHEMRSSAYSTWFRAGACVIMVERAEATEPATDSASMELIALECNSRPERDRLEARLVSSGVTIEDRSEHTIYFRDPDGRRWGASTYSFAD